jgi:hypothetical protein
MILSQDGSDYTKISIHGRTDKEPNHLRQRHSPLNYGTYVDVPYKDKDFKSAATAERYTGLFCFCVVQHRGAECMYTVQRIRCQCIYTIPCMEVPLASARCQKKPKANVFAAGRVLPCIKIISSRVLDQITTMNALLQYIALCID